MSAGTFPGFVTAALLLAFVIGVAWAFSARRKRDFEEAAQLPLEEDAGAGAEKRQ